jgi:ubiquinone/menaquinone biosynthesis C-methylase UbiE
MAGSSLRQFVVMQHGIPWKVRLLFRRLLPWRVRRRIARGRTNLNCPDTMDATYASLDDAFSSMDNLYDHLLPLLPEEGKLLDVGCGIGVLLRRIRDRYPELELSGVDFSAVGVERTQGYGFRADQAVLPAIPYPDRSVDCITATEVLEHLDNPLAAVRAFHRVLTAGGRVVVSVPIGMGPDFCDEHVQDFSEPTLRELLTEGGFVVQSIDSIVREPERCDAASLLATAIKDDSTDDYDTDYYTSRSQHPMWRVEAKLFGKLAGDSGKGTVIDVGCGSGDLLAQIGPKQGIGIDGNAAAIAVAQSRHPNCEFRLGDAGQLGVADRSADCIMGMHLIEHLSDPMPALSQWRQALKVGGRLVLTTPNRQFPHPEVFDDPDHKHIYTGPELKALLTEAGFRVKKAFAVGMWGVRRWPLLWRCQGLFGRMRWPRWWGQSLCVSAVREGEAC